MERITLDTNVVLDILEKRQGYEYVELIFDKYLSNEINLAITTRISHELGKTCEKLDKVAVLLELPSGFKTNISKVNKDLISYALESIPICKLLFPNTIHYNRHQVFDADILAAHKCSGRDSFLTRDSKMIKKRESLETIFGIKVLTPEEYVNNHGWI